MEDAGGVSSGLWFQVPCLQCGGRGTVMIKATEEHIRRAKMIDPGAWSLAGNEGRRIRAVEFADQQMRAVLE